MPLGWTARHKMHLDLGLKLNQNEIMTIIKKRKIKYNTNVKIK